MYKAVSHVLGWEKSIFQVCWLFWCISIKLIKFQTKSHIINQFKQIIFTLHEIIKCVIIPKKTLN